MKQRKWIVRAVAILLAALMLVSVIIVAMQAFGAEAADMPFINTGDSDKIRIPLYIAGGAVALFLICGVLPKLGKKKP